MKEKVQVQTQNTVCIPGWKQKCEMKQKVL